MSIFEHLEHEWHDAGQHVSGWFHHHGDNITTDPHDQAAPGAPMSLKTILDEGKTVLEDGEAKVRQFLDQHVPQLSGLADLIETNPIFTSVENALHVPPDILNGFAKALDALAAAYPKPEGDSTPEIAPAAEPAQQVN